MITEKDYLEAKKIIKDYENQQLNISGVRRHIFEKFVFKMFLVGFKK